MGGDWQLEYTTGDIEADEAISQSTQLVWNHVLATYTVTNINDSGAGSLRQAIIDANALAGTDTINFNIAGTGMHTIKLATLPTITDAVIMDASTDDSFAVNGNRPAIILDGNIAFTTLVCHQHRRWNHDPRSGHSTSRATASLSRRLRQQHHRGNYIGSLSATGANVAGEGNTANGVMVLGANNTIGGIGGGRPQRASPATCKASRSPERAAPAT